MVHMAEVQRSTGVGNEEGTGGEYGQRLAQSVCAGRGWWVSIKAGRERRRGVEMIDSTGSERQKVFVFFFSLSLFLAAISCFLLIWGLQSSEVAGPAHGCSVSEAGWLKKGGRGGLRAQQEHSIQFTGLSHTAPGAARGTLP